MVVLVQSLLRRKSYSLCTLSWLVLTLRSSFFVHSSPNSNSIFQPMLQAFPEAQRAMQDTHGVDKLLQELKTQYNPLSHLNENDKNQQLASFHLPVYQYVKTMLQRHRTVEKAKPIFIGISAPQGCGKTTLTNIICDLFRLEGKSCIAMSLDDFYLTGEQQEQLARMYPANKLLELRGNAGSHDLHLAMTTLHTLMNPTSSSNGAAAVQIPRYDKALRGGKGDRLPRDSWLTITERVDVVLFEGWMFGFNPLDEVSLPVWTNKTALIDAAGDSSHSSELQEMEQLQSAEEEIVRRNEFELAYSKAKSIQEVNELLRPYEALNMCMDAWLVLAVKDPVVVHKWRLQAEQQMRAQGRDGMSDEQVADFVDRYMPAYETYLSELYEKGPQRSPIRAELARPSDSSFARSGHLETRSSPVLKINVGTDRLPLSSEVMS